jgi:NAD(P)-dependent dehydrogenase (short-subunit alcohol dehydrogenase family)
MDGKICIVTGATSGIGKEIARGLVAHGAKVGIVGRNPEKTKATAEELGGAVETYLADLSELAQVRTLAAELHERNDRINVLVNNAGINSSQAQPTSEGYDAMLATNYLAPFLLTNLVVDLLTAGAPARVVNIASEAHRLSDRLDPDRLTDFSPSGRISGNRLYGRTKLALILSTQELATRLRGSGVTANSVCPGLVATNLVGEGSLTTRFAQVASSTPFVRRPSQGASVPLRLAIDAEFDGVTGQFFSSTPGAGLLPAHPARKDEALQQRLWEATEELVG